MPRIRCNYVDCIFLEAGFCIAEIIRIDPDEGCLTYTRLDEVAMADGETWEDDDLDEMWEDEEDELETDLEDGWSEDELI